MSVIVDTVNLMEAQEQGYRFALWKSTEGLRGDAVVGRYPTAEEAVTNKTRLEAADPLSDFYVLPLQ